MRRTPRLWIAGGLIAALAGCAGTPTIVDLPTGGVDRSLDLYGSFPVVVLGDPFPGLDHAGLTARVVAAMPHGLGRNLDFAAAGPAAPADPWTYRRIVWVFGPIAGGDGSAVCQSAGGGGPQPGRIRVYAALCRGPSAQAAVQAEVDGVATPDDPGFARLITDTVVELFAEPSPERITEGRPGW